MPLSINTQPTTNISDMSQKLTRDMEAMKQKMAQDMAAARQRAEDFLKQMSIRRAEPMTQDTVTISGSAMKAMGNSQTHAAAQGATQDKTITANIQSNLSAAQSSIRDADFAADTARLTRSQVLQQSGIAALAVANSHPQQVLSLLRG